MMSKRMAKFAATRELNQIYVNVKLHNDVMQLLLSFLNSMIGQSAICTNFVDRLISKQIGAVYFNIRNLANLFYISP